MRLIDKDDLILTILTNDLCDNDNVDKAILNAPIVKAITVEWIEKYIEPYKEHFNKLSDKSKETSGAGWVIDVLESTLRDWEKENDSK